MDSLKHQNEEGKIGMYLIRNATYLKLGEKCGIDFRMIHSWLMKYKGLALAVSINDPNNKATNNVNFQSIRNN